MIWKNIPLFKDFQVSNLGYVRATDRLIERKTKNGKHQYLRKGRILKEQFNKKGYPEVRICPENSKPIFQLVHKLVMLTFHGERPEGMQINHINGIKTDNRLENLEWITPSNNVKHAYIIGLISRKGEKNGRSKLTVQKVSDIKEKYQSGLYTQVQLAKEYNVSQHTIFSIKGGKTWSF